MNAFKHFCRLAGLLSLHCLLTACHDSRHAASNAGAGAGDSAADGGSAGRGVGDGDSGQPDAGSGHAGVAAQAGSGANGGTAAADGGRMSTGGSGGTSSGGSGASGRGGSGSTAGAGGNVGSATADPSAALFDQDSLPRFDITLTPEAISALTSNPTTYAHANLRYGDITLNDVAVRIKGESSLRSITQKAAFKIKLDEFVAGQNLFGLHRITLNNLSQDPTMLAERLAYHMYGAAKLPAPRCNHALVYVNDDFYGVYANIESEDKVFLKRFFSNASGNLYEDAEVDLIAGNESLFQLQTNEAVNDRSDLQGLTAAIAAAKDESFLADMGASLDTAHFLKFTAVEGALDQWDMYGYTYFDPNNFRLYHDPASGKFTFLPWGQDLALKPFLDGSLTHIPTFKVPVYENKPGNHEAGGVIFKRCLASASCKSTYAQVLKSVADLYDSEKLDELAAKYYAQIKSKVYDDWRKEYSDQDFDTANQNLLNHIRSRTSAIHADLQAAGY